MNYSRIFKASLLSLLCLSAEAQQQYQVPVIETDEPMHTGKYQPTWESLRQYEVPEWFRDAKFGIWAHWGPQCVEGSGDWMAREMYMEGNRKYDYNLKHYGHPSEVGFKDILPLFKAENWNPDELVRFYAEECGAQYFFALGNHHDNFDLWNSRYQEWNSQNIGPKTDILERWSKAARKNGLPFGISFHADHAWTWYEPSRRFDLKGDKIGVKYDGWLTREDGYRPNADGTEKWWKGLDPQKLYAQSHDFSERTWDNGGIHNQWGWENGAARPSQEFVTNFYNRTLDAINRYHPDLLYFDVTVLPFYPLSDAGMKIAAHQYNSTTDKHGQTQGIVFGKILDEEQKEALVWDVERGAPNKIMERPWQCCNCIGDWHYNTSYYERDRYKSAATIAKLLVDIVSKNGNMLLSVPLRADGTPDEKELAIMKEFGAWMQLNKEGIIKTRPWKIFGEGPIASADISINAQGFNDGNYVKAGSDEIRFTQSKDGKQLYAMALAWPADHRMVIKALADTSSLYTDDIRQITLLGYGKVKFERTPDALIVTLPEQNLNNIMPVLRIEGKPSKAAKTAAAATTAADEWQLIWHDEFDGTGPLNTDIWQAEHGFVRNEEHQWYQQQNAYRQDGILVLEGRLDSIPNPRYREGSQRWQENRPYAQYSSASVHTRKSFSFLYGKMEVRARIPAVMGSWPAIWTLGTQGEWPSNGEIDIMEYYHIKGVPHILANAAWGNDRHYSAVWNSKTTPYSHFLEKDPYWGEKYHTWTMDWTPDHIRIYLDGELLNDVDLSKTINGSIGGHTNPFHAPQYILLDLAIGGINGGTPQPEAFPMRYEIDYIRVYQKKNIE